MDGFRKAAYLLAQLDDADQRWMLAQLPESIRSKLLYLVTEAKQIGVVHGTAVLEGGIDEIQSLLAQTGLAADIMRGRTDSATVARPSVPNYVERIERLDVDQVVTALNTLPLHVTRAFLQANDWPWRNEAGQRLNIAIGAPDKNNTSKGVVTTIVQDKLVEKVCRKILSESVMQSTIAPTANARSVFFWKRNR